MPSLNFNNTIWDLMVITNLAEDDTVENITIKLQVWLHSTTSSYFFVKLSTCSHIMYFSNDTANFLNLEPPLNNA